MQFKDVLKSLREEKKLSQKDVAKECNVSTTCICQLETGARNPTGSTLELLADFFGCSIDYLVGREDDFGTIVIKKPSSIVLTPDEELLLAMFQSLDPLHQKQVLGYVEGFAERAHPNKKKKF